MSGLEVGASYVTFFVIIPKLAKIAQHAKNWRKELNSYIRELERLQMLSGAIKYALDNIDSLKDFQVPNGEKTQGLLEYCNENSVKVIEEANTLLNRYEKKSLFARTYQWAQTYLKDLIPNLIRSVEVAQSMLQKALSIAHIFQQNNGLQNLEKFIGREAEAIRRSQLNSHDGVSKVLIDHDYQLKACIDNQEAKLQEAFQQYRNELREHSMQLYKANEESRAISLKLELVSRSYRSSARHFLATMPPGSEQPRSGSKNIVPQKSAKVQANRPLEEAGSGIPTWHSKINKELKDPITDSSTGRSSTFEPGAREEACRSYFEVSGNETPVYETDPDLPRNRGDGEPYSDLPETTLRDCVNVAEALANEEQERFLYASSSPSDAAIDARMTMAKENGSAPSSTRNEVELIDMLSIHDVIEAHERTAPIKAQDGNPKENYKEHALFLTDREPSITPDLVRTTNEEPQAAIDTELDTANLPSHQSEDQDTVETSQYSTDEEAFDEFHPDDVASDHWWDPVSSSSPTVPECVGASQSCTSTLSILESQPDELLYPSRPCIISLLEMVASALDLEEQLACTYQAHEHKSEGLERFNDALVNLFQFRDPVILLIALINGCRFGDRVPCYSCPLYNHQSVSCATVLEKSYSTGLTYCCSGCSNKNRISLIPKDEVDQSESFTCDSGTWEIHSDTLVTLPRILPCVNCAMIYSMNEIPLHKLLSARGLAYRCRECMGFSAISLESDLPDKMQDANTGKGHNDKEEKTIMKYLKPFEELKFSKEKQSVTVHRILKKRRLVTWTKLLEGNEPLRGRIELLGAADETISDDKTADNSTAADNTTNKDNVSGGGIPSFDSRREFSVNGKTIALTFIGLALSVL